MKDVTVYPRWRGEHMSRVSWVGVSSGLSPLARGTLDPAKIASDMGRFIPAGAGNTCASSVIAVINPVYPRWRGEHLKTFFHLLMQCGLSPLARGTPHSFLQTRSNERFIPAGAGNTDEDVENDIADAVYPRWRGEHL